MARKIWSAIAGLSSCAAVATLVSDSSVKDRKNVIEKATNRIEHFREVRGVPGICVGVSYNGRLLWASGFGYADLEQMIPCAKDTVMRIASISKPITMALVAKLWQEGKLDIDAPIQKYVPSFPQKTFQDKPVTITTRQLISHMGGIRHYHEDYKKKEKDSNSEKENTSKPRMENEWEYYNTKDYKSVEDAMEMFRNDPLAHEPGSTFLYTTYGWTLVSAIAEGAAGGKSFESQIEEMLRRFGMHDTCLDKNDRIILNRARYFVRNDKGVLKNVPEVNNSYKWAGGGLLSTVENLLVFGNAMLYFRQNKQPAITVFPQTVSRKDF